MLLNNTLIIWMSKRQKTIETLSYDSELVASWIATELMLKVTYLLWSLGVALDGTTEMLGDNMSVMLNKSVPSNVLRREA
jgi:hypothetical protein